MTSQKKYKGFHLEQTPEGVVRIYESAEDWMLRQPVYVADDEHHAKLWVDLLVGDVTISLKEPGDSDLMQLEVDVNRGVLYLHSLLTSQTLLRVCRIPDDLVQLFASGMVAIVIDLKKVPMRREGVSRRRYNIKTEPVYIRASELTPEGIGDFSIIDSMGRTHFQFTSVPERVMKQMWKGEFVDITIGVTGR